ncbi:MAG: hypothetical protein VR73_00710 [Gammaproteobacteria bacterium BRH_c0]|nr:MAG: hypothetical protein VR73_00710 [Gammaproteobacteria bacterium BRH_c0]
MASPRSERLPLEFDKVDAAWLTRTLQTQYPGVVVNSMEVTQFIPGHTTKARVKLDLNQAGIDAGLPEDVCLKANWSGSPMSSPVCVNEARFYHSLATQMPVPSPKCYFADWDDDEQSQQGFIILEDLIPLGGEFGYSHQPISVEDMAKSLDGMAMMHGRSWGHPELDNQTWVQTAMAPETATDDYWMMMPDYFARHNSIPERLEIFPRWMAADTQRLYSAFQQLCEHDRAYTGPRCLVHGDAHLGNTYRRPDGTRIWFDWQIVRKGLPWRDLTYFLVGSMEIADRRKAGDDLIKYYLQQLAANGGPEFSLEQAQEEVSRWVIWGLIAWQSNINPQQETMCSLERFCRAADDMDTQRFYQF